MLAQWVQKACVHSVGLPMSSLITGWMKIENGFLLLSFSAQSASAALLYR
jgi:hypothetical protein